MGSTTQLRSVRDDLLLTVGSQPSRWKRAASPLIGIVAFMLFHEMIDPEVSPAMGVSRLYLELCQRDVASAWRCDSRYMYI
jgi:hypothetical protein